MSASFEPKPVRMEDVSIFRQSSGLSMQDARSALARRNEMESMIRLLKESQVSPAEYWLLMRHAEREGYAHLVRRELSSDADQVSAGT